MVLLDFKFVYTAAGCPCAIKEEPKNHLPQARCRSLTFSQIFDIIIIENEKGGDANNEDYN